MKTTASTNENIDLPAIQENESIIMVKTVQPEKTRSGDLSASEISFLKVLIGSNPETA